jgi:predicted adenylyl cyclase CyaB
MTSNYEIEKRSLLTDKEYSRITKYLKDNAKLISSKNLITMLFKEPSYIRIRYEEGKDKAKITIKNGTYHDKARTETEKDIKLSDVKASLKKLEKKGFKKCALLKSKRETYKYDKYTIDVSNHQYLGIIIEIELVTDNKKLIDKESENISKLFKKMKLKELDADKYQKMMNDMYKKSSIDIKEIRI